MAHVENPFQGSMHPDDPRDLIFGCGGCSWPSVPAWKLFLCSNDATGLLSFFNTTGVLCTIRPSHIDPNNMQWDLEEGPISVLDAFVLKNRFNDPYGYGFAVAVTGLWGVMETSARWPEQNCNITHWLPEATVTFGLLSGSTGETFRIKQVLWDDVRPPGGWPLP
jgi:hypothetical protein